MGELEPELARHLDTVERLIAGREVDGWEIMATRSRDLNIEVKGGRLDSFKCAEPFGLSLRVLAGDGLGYSFATTLDAAALDRMVEGALTAARMQTPDPGNLLPGASPRYPEIPGLFDETLALIPEDDKIERALELERLVLSSDPRVKRVRKCSYGESLHSVAIRNSRGLEAGYRGSYASLSVSAVAEEGGSAQSGWDYGFANGYAGLDPVLIAARAGRKATALLGAGRMPTMRCPAVLDNRVAAALLELLSHSFLGDNVVKGKSLLAGRVGEAIFSKLLTMRDNGIAPGGMGSAPFDGEGVPQQDTLLAANGVLKRYLFDSSWGGRMGESSTGNALRSAVKGPPRIGAHNLCIDPGLCPPEALIAGIGRGVLVTEVMGMHTANPISGEFSVGAAGFYLEGGEIRHPVKGIAIAGNLLELFRGVDLVACDLRFFGAVGSPSLRVGELDVSGS